MPQCGILFSKEVKMIDKRVIEDYIKSDVKVLVFDELTSTNNKARKLAEQGKTGFTLVIARKQSGGRGRMGRSFFSPEGGLYMSLLINERLPAHMSLGITTAAAVAVARAIDKIAGGRSKIKWVNDVYRNGKKVCGILTEAKADCDGFLKWAVLGIGVNLTAPDGGFPEEIAMRAGAVFDEISDDCDNRLCAAIVDEFMDMYRKGLSPSLYLDEYRDRSNVIGQRIDVMRIHDGEAVPATAVAIDEECRLVVSYDDGRAEALGSGDVSLRLN